MSGLSINKMHSNKLTVIRKLLIAKEVIHTNDLKAPAQKYNVSTSQIH